MSDPEVSTYFCGILYELNARPKYSNTYTWVSSLQTGHRGFGETTGENSWDYTTVMGSQMHKFLNLKPRYEKDFISFARLHQNGDGGFGAIINAPSESFSTLDWAISLIELGYQPRDKNGLIRLLNNSLNPFPSIPLNYLYKIVYVLTNLGVNVELKDEIVKFLIEKYNSTLKLSKNIIDLFYIIAILEMFGGKIDFDTTFVLSCQNQDGGFGNFPFHRSSPRTTYHAVKLLKIFKKISPSIKKRILDYVYQHEQMEGGFRDKNRRNTYMAYCSVLGLKKLGYEPKYKDKLILWIKSCQNEDGGFGYYPNSESLDKATFWSIEILKLFDKITLIDREKLIKYLSANIENIQPAVTYYLVGTCDDMNVLPHNYNKIFSELLKFQNQDGGFGSYQKTYSHMYETFRAVHSFYYLQQVLERNKIEHEDFIKKVKGRVIKWIYSCENKDGGFSWIPKEKSYVQPTYLAISTLDLLSEKIRNSKKHFNWIVKNQNEDGGFRGGEDKTPSDFHFTDWAISSLKISNS